MRNLGIIPARGGSKGIRRKNLRMLAGRPLIAHTIETASQSRSVQRVVVSTDDREIGVIAREYGAGVVWRPAELSGDRASSEAALLHALEQLRLREGYEPQLVVFLQCTSPLISPKDIDGTVQALMESNADSALAATPFHHFLWRRDAAGGAMAVNHDRRVRLSRQELEPQYRESGAVYVMRTAGFLQARHRFFGKTAMHIIPPERCLEIDEPLDLQIAELLCRQKMQRRNWELLPHPVSAVVLDFDGVLTDNKVFVSNSGEEAVVCDRSDGLGLAQVRKLGLPVLVLSSEKNPVVQFRCEKLGISCRHGLEDKLAVLDEWLGKQRIEHSQVVFVGNDVNDLTCMAAVGCSVAVADAHPRVLAAARIVLGAQGGQGAVRELADLILDKLNGAFYDEND